MATNGAHNTAKNAPQNCVLLFIKGHRKGGAEKKNLNLWRGRDFLAPIPSVRQPPLSKESGESVVRFVEILETRRTLNRYTKRPPQDSATFFSIARIEESAFYCTNHRASCPTSPTRLHQSAPKERRRRRAGKWSSKRVFGESVSSLPL